MKTPLETKTAAVAAIPAKSTLVLFAAVVDGNPTAAQIETARYTLAANLENVGATATSAYLTRFEPVELNVDADEGLLLTVDATLSKVSPDPLPDAAEAEAFDETLSPEVASNEEVANDENGVETETTDAPPFDENAAAIAESEASEA